MITRAFVLAGRAVFTVSNPAGVYYTIKVLKRQARTTPEGRNGPPRWRWYVFLRSVGQGRAPGDTSLWAYLGLLDGPFRSPPDSPVWHLTWTRRSERRETDQAFQVARWALGVIGRGGPALPEGYRIDHEGRCGRCGRALTTPASLAVGLGEECHAIMQEGRR